VESACALVYVKQSDVLPQFPIAINDTPEGIQTQTRKRKPSAKVVGYDLDDSNSSEEIEESTIEPTPKRKINKS